MEDLNLRDSPVEQPMGNVQYLMGHSEIATTLNIYTHVNAEQVKSEMKKLENIM